MSHNQGVQPAVSNKEELDVVSEGPREKKKSRSRGLAKQARKLKNVFKRQEMEVQESSARLGQHHGIQEQPLHETQIEENMPEHSQSSTENLPASSNEQSHSVYGNALESSPTQEPIHIASASIYSGISNQDSKRPEEPAQLDGVDPSSVPPPSQTNQDFDSTFSLPSSLILRSIPIPLQQQYSEPNQPHISQETKRRRRRESHNLVERRRRDKINELLQQLSGLVPLRRFKDYNAKVPRFERTEESLERGPSKGDILNESVNWTRDLMWALYRKIQQQDKAKEYIDWLGGTWPFESNEDETRLRNEVIDAFDANGKISISPRPWDSEINAKRPERFESLGGAINAKGANHSEPALRPKASRGSLISFSGSVHSFTSLTYRSTSGEIMTEHVQNVSNLETKLAPRNDGSKQSIAGADKEQEEDAFWIPRTAPDGRLFYFNTLTGVSKNVITQTFATSQTYEELDNAPSPGRDQDGAPIPDKQSPRLTPESHTSLDALDGSHRDENSPGNSHRLDEADTLVKDHLADVKDLSVQNQTHLPIAAKLEEKARLRRIRVHEDSSFWPRSSIASSSSHQGLVESDPRVTYLENKLVRLRWKCSCDHPFQMDVLEHEKGAALAAIQELDQSNRARDESSGPLRRLFMFLIRMGFLLHIFSDQREMDEILPTTNPLPTKADDMIQTRLNPADPDPERYVCVCFPGMTYKKYLHHVDVNETIDDQHLFAAMQKKYHDWKPFWRRIFTLRTLVRVEYFEFKIYYSNLVTIKDDWRDRFPQGHDPGEWSYNPTSRDMTPYLIDDVLTHYVHSPQCAKAGKYFWNRIPKKVFCKLECPNDKPFKVGWGLYFVEEFSQFYLMLVLVPVLAAGIALAIWYCIWFHKSFADGATVVSGFAAVVMYLFSVAQGWYKQKGAL